MTKDYLDFILPYSSKRMSPRLSCKSLLIGEDSKTNLSPLLSKTYKLPNILLFCVSERSSPTRWSILSALDPSSLVFAPATHECSLAKRK